MRLVFLIIFLVFSSALSAASFEERLWLTMDHNLDELEEDLVIQMQEQPQEAVWYYLLSSLYLRQAFSGRFDLFSQVLALATQAKDIGVDQDWGDLAFYELWDALGREDLALSVLSGLGSSWRLNWIRLRRQGDLNVAKMLLNEGEAPRDLVVAVLCDLLEKNNAGLALVQQLKFWQRSYSSHYFDYYLGKHLVLQGEFEAALRYYKQIPDDFYMAAQVKFDMAKILYKLGRFDEAQNLFLSSEFLEDSADYLGKIAVIQRDFVGAKKWFLRAWAKGKLSGLEELESLYGEFRGEFDALLFALSLDGPWPEVHAFRGKLFAESFDFDASTRNFRAAGLLSPYEVAYPTAIAFNYLRLRDYRKAVEFLDQALSLAPDDGELWGRRACVQNWLQGNGEGDIRCE